MPVVISVDNDELTPEDLVIPPGFPLTLGGGEVPAARPAPVA